MQKHNILIHVLEGLSINGRVDQSRGKMKWKYVYDCLWLVSVIGTV